MSEFFIKDEDLSSLKGKIVVLTGTKLILCILLHAWHCRWPTVLLFDFATQQVAHPV